MSLIIEPVRYIFIQRFSIVNLVRNDFRPKYLCQYINLTAEDEKSIYSEYKVRRKNLFFQREKKSLNLKTKGFRRYVSDITSIAYWIGTFDLRSLCEY